jgi:predicted DNA-binding ribbon-helix-helix protein
MATRTKSRIDRSGRWKPRSIWVDGHRSTVRLEPVMWEALGDIARHHSIPVIALIDRIGKQRPSGYSLTSAIRVYIVEFYRAAVRR